MQGADLSPGDRVLIMGPGTIGLLCTLFARAAGAEVHVLGLPGPDLEFARSLGLANAWTQDTLPDLPLDAVIDAATSPDLSAWALSQVEPGGRVVFIGIAGEPSRLDSRDLVLGDVTAVGVLSASPALAETISLYAAGTVDPRPLIAATISLEQVAGVLRRGTARRERARAPIPGRPRVSAAMASSSARRSTSTRGCMSTWAEASAGPTFRPPSHPEPPVTPRCLPGYSKVPTSPQRVTLLR